MSFAGKLMASGASLSSDAHWIGLGAWAASHAGTNVTETTTSSLPAAQRAVKIIAGCVAQLPIDVMQSTGGRKESRSDHPIARLLNQRPNPLMSAFTLRSVVQSHAVLWGNGYVEIERNNGGTPIGLWPLLPDRTSRSPEDGARYTTSVKGARVSVRGDDMLHILAPGFDGLSGTSLVAQHRNALGLALALEEFGGRYFANDAKSGGFLKHPGKLSDGAKKNLAESMQEQGGLTKAHRVKILEEGMEFQAISVPNNDAQFLESRAFQVEEISRIFGVPPVMLHAQKGATPWGAGIAQIMLGFVTVDLAPWLVSWEQELATKLFTEGELADGYYLRHNLNALLRGDADTRANVHTKALNKETGWMSRNEVRALEDLNPDGA